MHGIGIEEVQVREQLEPFRLRVFLPSVDINLVNQHLRILVADETDIRDLQTVILEQVSDILQLGVDVFGDDNVHDGEVRVDRWLEMGSPRRDWTTGRGQRLGTGTRRRTLQHIRVTWAGRRCGGGDDRLIDAKVGVEPGVQCSNMGWEIEDISDLTIH